VESKVPRSLIKLLMTDPCPDEQALAAYADRQLIGAERHAIEHHISKCDICAGQIAFLVRTSEELESQIPDELLASAMCIGNALPKQSKPNWTLAVAGAFVVTIAMFLSFLYPRHEKSPKPEPEVSAQSTLAENHQNGNPLGPRVQPPDLRGVEVTTSPFLFPAPNQTVDGTILVFRWKEFAGADVYEIELLTDDGNFVWGQKVSYSSAALPRSVHLAKGGTYFVKLSIHHANGFVEQTKAVAFIAG
jgi:hypothetical protein